MSEATTALRWTRPAFRRIVWGLLIVWLDVNANVDGNQFDFFVDAIGWGLVLSALVQLAPAHAAFHVARRWAIVSLLLSLPLVVQIDVGNFAELSSGNAELTVSRWMPLELLRGFSELLCLWSVAGAIAAIANDLRDDALATSALRRRVFLLVAMIIAVGISWIALAVREPVLMVLSLAPVFIAGFLMLRLIWRAGNLVDASFPPPAAPTS